MVANKNRINEYSVLRVLAMILVVIGHCQIFYIGNIQFDIPKTTMYYIFEIIVEIIYKFHMPLFFFLSGAIYFVSTNYRNKYNTLKELIVSKFKRLIIPYFAVSFFMLIPMRALIGVYNNSNILKGITKDILLFHDPAHLWFLPVLFTVFVLFYIIAKLSRRPFIIYLIVAAVYIAALKIPDRYDLSLRYLLWFTFGYAFESVRIKYNQFLKGKNIALSITLIIIFAALFVVKTESVMINLAMSNILTASGILITYNIALCLSNSNKFMSLRVFGILNKYNFDIYLYHDIFNYIILFILQSFGLLVLFNTAPAYLLLMLIKTVGVTVLSVLLAILCKTVVKKGIKARTKNG